MNARKTFPTFVWALLGLIALSAVLLSLGQWETRSDPSADSYAPSGTLALWQLLEKRGDVNLVLDRRPLPRFRAGDLLVLFAPENDMPLLGSELPETMRLNRRLSEHLTAGGRAVLFPLPENFLLGSRSVKNTGPVVVTRTGDGAKRTVSAADDALPSVAFQAIPYEAPQTDLYRGEDGTSFVRLAQIGKGTLAVFRDGTVATNRFLDQQQNAAVVTEVIGRLAPKGARVVFAEATFGNVRGEGITGLIGSWLKAAWYQLLFLGLVVVYTLGKRFGLPEPMTRVQRRGRELTDALAGSYQRMNDGRILLTAALSDSERRLRHRYRIPRDASEQELDRYCSDQVRRLVRMARAGVQGSRLRPADAERLALDLHTAVEQQVSELGQHREAVTVYKAG